MIANSNGPAYHINAKLDPIGINHRVIMFMAKYCLIALNDICSYHIRYGYLDGLDDVDLSLSGLIGSSKQVKQTFK